MVFVHETTRVLLARFLLIPSDDDLTLSMIRPTSITICVGLGEGVWSAVVSIGVVLP